MDVHLKEIREYFKDNPGTIVTGSELGQKLIKWVKRRLNHKHNHKHKHEQKHDELNHSKPFFSNERFGIQDELEILIESKILILFLTLGPLAKIFSYIQLKKGTMEMLIARGIHNVFNNRVINNVMSYIHNNIPLDDDSDNSIRLIRYEVMSILNILEIAQCISSSGSAEDCYQKFNIDNLDAYTRKRHGIFAWRDVGQDNIEFLQKRIRLNV